MAFSDECGVFDRDGGILKMKNIKFKKVDFKAWDTKNETFTNFMITDNMLKFMDKLTGVWFRDDEQKRFKLLQNTRLKDKNGKEIYAGDICRWRDLETFNDEVLEDIFVVVWNDEKLAWYTQNEDGNFVYELYEYTDDRDLEVIGNIYENKGLLEVEE